MIFLELEVKAKLEPYAKIVHKAENVVVGETQTVLNYEDCVYGECTLGDLLVDAFAEYVCSYIICIVCYVMIPVTVGIAISAVATLCAVSSYPT